MRSRVFAAALAALLTASPAAAQTPFTNLVMPPNTILGNPSPQSGFGSAIPFSILAQYILAAAPVPVGTGGTGATTFTVNGVLYGNGTSAILAPAQGAANSVLTANAGSPTYTPTPTVTTLAATSSATTPLVIGGITSSATLTLESTSGTGL